MFIIETGLRTKGNLVVGTETIDRSMGGIGTVMCENRNVRRVFVTLTAIVGWLALGLLPYVASNQWIGARKATP
jgi:hypothetical protein